MICSQRSVLILFAFLAGATIVFLFYDADETKGDITDVLRKQAVARGSLRSTKNNSGGGGGGNLVNSTSELITTRDKKEEKEAVAGAALTRNLPPFNESDLLPAWTALPRTRFTEHVVEIILNLKADVVAHQCVDHYKLVVNGSSSNSTPTVQCDAARPGDWVVWCKTLTRICASQSIPYDISIGFLLNDFFDPKEYGNACIGSSSRGAGRFCMMPNMEDLQKMVYTEQYKSSQSELYSFGYRDAC
jgi:hypothetical protein